METKAGARARCCGAVALWAWSGGSEAAGAAAGMSLPNVVFILAADIGYADLAAYHEATTGTVAVVPTPHLDRLAEEGMMFLDAHTPAALCAPNRFSIMTGSNPYRSRPWNAGDALDHGEFLADGFGDSEFDTSEHGPILSGKAVDFITDHLARFPTQPFLLYYAAPAIHVPLTPSAAGLVADGVTGLGQRADFVYDLDLQIGQILAKLDEAGIADNTLVLFTSDNGAPSRPPIPRCWPASGPTATCVQARGRSMKAATGSRSWPVGATARPPVP